MTRHSLPEAPHTSLRAVQVLDLLADALRSGAPVVRSFAVMPLQDAGLRIDIARNPRLADRINARLFVDDGWVLPDHLEDFPQADVLISLLRHGPAQVFRGLGFAWHGNAVAHSLLSGDRTIGTRLSREDLRRVLMVRELGPTDAAGPVPEDAEVDRAGALCLWCWMAALPKPIQALGLAVLLKDCCAHVEHSALDPEDRARRREVADAWLRAALALPEVAS